MERVCATTYTQPQYGAWPIILLHGSRLPVFEALGKDKVMVDTDNTERLRTVHAASLSRAAHLSHDSVGGSYKVRHERISSGDFEVWGQLPRRCCI